MIYLQGESTNTNRLCTFHFFNLLVVNPDPGKMSSSPVVELVLSTCLSERATAAAAFSMHSDWKKKSTFSDILYVAMQKKRDKNSFELAVLWAAFHTKALKRKSISSKTENCGGNTIKYFPIWQNSSVHIASCQNF